MPGIAIAYPKKGKNAKEETKEKIRKYNTMEIYKDNLDQLRVFKEKTGTGILHFNNPLQLLDRLELLIGSLFLDNRADTTTLQHPCCSQTHHDFATATNQR